MGYFLSFVLFWIGIMALIGIALWIVPKIGKSMKKEEKVIDKDNTQDIADE